MQEDHVITVDAADRPIGTMGKLAAHEEGVLHRALSVFIFNAAGKLMLQRRAWSKYHSGGLWTNTCCSHPRPGEDTATAAHRRLLEEMGFDCDFRFAFSFEYRAQVGDLIEHELDHVFVGTYEDAPRPSADEVAEWAWVDVDAVSIALFEEPELYTEWFKLVWERVRAWRETHQEVPTRSFAAAR
jgi:isopentenyl-diphosphate Delta-isomerase